LQYAELEEEVSNYHLNNIMNGLSPSMLINFNNGTPNQQERQLIETRIAQKFSGTSNAGKFILAFNDNKESQAEITPVQLSDAHNQYQFLSEESTSKIMVAHRIVSPMLLGIKDGSGLGNNAEEIKTASLLMDNTVIRPFQELLIDSFDNILAYNDISLNLYFTTLQPLEFTEVDQTLQDKETIEEETGVEMSSDRNELTDEMANSILENLKFETIGDDYELVDVRDVSDKNSNSDEWANSLIKKKLSKIRKFADFIKSKPNEESKLDKSYYKIRYTYQEKVSSTNSRDFCKTMMGRTSRGVVYRKEDIDNASFQGVNNDFGHKGQNYSLFEFKGGIYCGHYWQEELYRMKDKTEKYISKGKEVNSIPNEYQPKGKEYQEAGIAPTDMKDRGAYPN
jgi:hypothetical protein